MSPFALLFLSAHGWDSGHKIKKKKKILFFKQLYLIHQLNPGFLDCFWDLFCERILRAFSPKRKGNAFSFSAHTQQKRSYLREQLFDVNLRQFFFIY
jgi:hypothetical protein